MRGPGFPFRTLRLGSITWWLTCLCGWLLIAYGLCQLAETPRIALAPAFVMTAALALMIDLFPLMQGRKHNPQGVVMSSAFVFALMFVWGPWPAILSAAIGSLAADLRAGKTWWKVAFNPAQYALALFAGAWVVVEMLGGPTLSHPYTTFRSEHLIWMASAWVVYVLLNFTLVAAVLSGESSFRANFMEDFRHEIRLTLGVLAISPLVLAIATGWWILLPLLLIPMLILYQTGQIAVESDYAAGHDALTGLPNRVTLGFELDRAFAEHERGGAPFALMLMDLNDFKRVNDTLGHQVGDALLVRFSDRLRNAMRSGDCVARLGGDEFAMLVFDVDGKGATAVAERVHELVSAAVVIDSITLEISMSLGIAMCPQHGVDGTALLRRADVAMYSAKAQHQGIALYSAERDENSSDQLELVGQLRQALHDGDIEMVYQPKVAADDSTPIGFEALVRWRHATRGEIRPDDFIELAERSGVMPALTARVLELAIVQCLRWREMGIELPVAVNVAPSDLSGTTLVTLVDSLLDRYDVEPSMLILEITERMATQQVDEAEQTLQELRRRGVRISLDDFGTGYSSLVRLSSLSVDEIKIDRAFVAAMATGDEAVSIVRTIIELAHALGLPAIAEGVEDREQWRILGSLGCNGLQGWQVAHPMPAHEATDWVKARLAYGRLQSLQAQDAPDLGQRDVVAACLAPLNLVPADIAATELVADQHDGEHNSDSTVTAV